MLQESPPLAGRFKLTALLGEGGMASVYRALDLRSDQELAVKVMRTPDGGSAPDRSAAREARFKLEFEVALGLKSSPGVVRVGEFFPASEEHASFYTMELLTGCTVAEYIQRTPSSDSHRDIVEGLLILRKLSDALAAVHSNGIVFCDLKPGNVFISSGSDAAVKLFDFGIAQRVSDGSSPTSSPSMVGTSLYMAPEQIRGESLTPSADIYSFGVLAFELISGRPPFSDPELFNVTASHLASSVPSLREVVPKASGALERMIRICMEKSPKDRYPSMTEVKTRLDSLILAEKPKSSWLKRLKELFGLGAG